MSTSPWPRLVALAVMAFLSVLLVSCGPFDPTVTTDPCLLGQYQGRSYGIVGHIQGAYSTLAGRANALQGPHYTISASADISETLFALTEFQDTLIQQQNYLAHDTPAPPTLGLRFARQLRRAIDVFQGGARLLAAAYVDDQAGNTRAAQDITIQARIWMRQGRGLLDAAGVTLSQLQTNSPNC